MASPQKEKNGTWTGRARIAGKLDESPEAATEFKTASDFWTEAAKISRLYSSLTAYGRLELMLGRGSAHGAPR